jgi:hypothetical protein
MYAPLHFCSDVFCVLKCPLSSISGTTRDLRRVPSRIILLSLLLLSLFLTASYSAIIVSLLQTTSTAINTLEDLMNSRFTLTMNDVATSINYVNVSSGTLFSTTLKPALIQDPEPIPSISRRLAVLINKFPLYWKENICESELRHIKRG